MCSSCLSCSRPSSSHLYPVLHSPGPQRIPSGLDGLCTTSTIPSVTTECSNTPAQVISSIPETLSWDYAMTVWSCGSASPPIKGADPGEKRQKWLRCRQGSAPILICLEVMIPFGTQNDPEGAGQEFCAKRSRMRMS